MAATIMMLIEVKLAFATHNLWPLLSDIYVTLWSCSRFYRRICRQNCSAFIQTLEG